VTWLVTLYVMVGLAIRPDTTVAEIAVLILCYIAGFAANSGNPQQKPNVSEASPFGSPLDGRFAGNGLHDAVL
jgi:hypothetical protein